MAQPSHSTTARTLVLSLSAFLLAVTALALSMYVPSVHQRTFKSTPTFRVLLHEELPPDKVYRTHMHAHARARPRTKVHPSDWRKVEWLRDAPARVVQTVFNATVPFDGYHFVPNVTSTALVKRWEGFLAETQLKWPVSIATFWIVSGVICDAPAFDKP